MTNLFEQSCLQITSSHRNFTIAFEVAAFRTLSSTHFEKSSLVKTIYHFSSLEDMWMTFISIFSQTFKIQIECRIFFFHLDACNWHSSQNFYIRACILSYLLSSIFVDHLSICSLSFMMITFIMQFLQNITAFFLKIHHSLHRSSLVESFKQMFILNHEFQRFMFEFSKFFCWHFERAR